MAEQQETTDGVAGAEGKPSKGGGKTFLVTIVAVVLVAAGAGAAAAYLFFPQVTSIITGTQDAAGELAETEEPVEFGEFLELNGFMVNPADTGGRRALMVNVGLEGPDTKVMEAVTAKEVVIRDRILGKLSKLTVDQLSDISIRDSIKQDILRDINRLFPEEKLSRLYFTAYILQ